MNFVRNMGKTDRIIRIVLGALLVASALTGMFSPWGWIGVILLATAFLNFCPIYALFGFRTCRR